MKLLRTLPALAIALAACAGGEEPTGPDVTPLFASGGGTGQLLLCKFTEEATTATFDFEVSATSGKVPGNGRFTLAATQGAADETCKVVWTENGGGAATVTVAESPQLGWELYRVSTNWAGDVEPVDGSVDLAVLAGFPGVVFFKNRPVPIDMAPGRMTGGGGQITIEDVNITRGFTIHCDITLSNNVNVVWHDDTDHWHIDKPLTSAECLDNGDPTPPVAPFNTFIGEGIGKLNGVDGSFIRFTFVDNGEPGRNDQAAIAIWAPGDDPEVDAPVKEVPLTNLDHGNIQAHYDQPHR